MVCMHICISQLITEWAMILTKSSFFLLPFIYWWNWVICPVEFSTFWVWLIVSLRFTSIINLLKIYISTILSKVCPAKYVLLITQNGFCLCFLNIDFLISNRRALHSWMCWGKGKPISCSLVGEKSDIYWMYAKNGLLHWDLSIWYHTSFQ